MDEFLQKFLPVMTSKDDLVDQIARETGTKIYTTPYIEPWILDSIETKKAQWKLRQPYFRDDFTSGSFKDHVFKKLKQLRHPYYKRITVLDKINGYKIKIYSMEARKNFCLQYQGGFWANNIQKMNLVTNKIPKLIYNKTYWNLNIHVAVFEYIDGRVLSDNFSETTQYDDGHPDVQAGRLEPYIGTIYGVGWKSIPRVKRGIENILIELCKSSQKIDFGNAPMQRLDNEPDWEERWLPRADKKVWHVDDWSLENIICTDTGYRLINLDRAVLTDVNNCVQRFISDFRSQTNLRWDYDKLLKTLNEKAALDRAST